MSLQDLLSINAEAANLSPQQILTSERDEDFMQKVILTGDDDDYVYSPFTGLKEANLNPGVYFKVDTFLYDKEGNEVARNIMPKGPAKTKEEVEADKQEKLLLQARVPISKEPTQKENKKQNFVTTTFEDLMSAQAAENLDDLGNLNYENEELIQNFNEDFFNKVITNDPDFKQIRNEILNRNKNVLLLKKENLIDKLGLNENSNQEDFDYFNAELSDFIIDLIGSDNQFKQYASQTYQAIDNIHIDKKSDYFSEKYTTDFMKKIPGGEQLVNSARKIGVGKEFAALAAEIDNYKTTENDLNKLKNEPKDGSINVSISGGEDAARPIRFLKTGTAGVPLTEELYNKYLKLNETSLNEIRQRYADNFEREYIAGSIKTGKFEKLIKGDQSLKQVGLMLADQLPQLGSAFVSLMVLPYLQMTGDTYSRIIEEETKKRFNIPDGANIPVEKLVEVATDQNFNFEKRAAASGVFQVIPEAIGLTKVSKVFLEGFKEVSGSIIRGQFARAGKGFLRSGVKNITEGGLAEAITEGVQLGVEDITVGSFSGIKAYVESIGTGLTIGTVLPSVGNVVSQTSTELQSGYRKISGLLNENSTEAYFNNQIKELNNQKEIAFTDQQKKDLQQKIDDLTDLRNSNTSIPSNFTTRARSKAIDLLLEKKKLLRSIKDKDSSLSTVENKRIKEIDQELGIMSLTEMQVESIIKGLVKDEDIDVEAFDTTEEAKQFIKQKQKEGKDISIKKAGDYGFIVQDPKTSKQIIVINKDESNKDGFWSTSAHEFLHAILFKYVKNNTKVGQSLGRALFNQLAKIDISQLNDSEYILRLSAYLNRAQDKGRIAAKEQEIRQEYPNLSEAKIDQALEIYKEKELSNAWEEALPLFVDALMRNDIKVEQSFLDLIKAFLRRAQRALVFRGKSVLGGNIVLNEDKDVLNFLLDYTRAAKKGNYAAFKSLVDRGITGKLVEVEKVTKDETTRLAESVKLDEDTRAELRKEFNKYKEAGPGTKMRLERELLQNKDVKSTIDRVAQAAVNRYFKGIPKNLRDEAGLTEKDYSYLVQSLVFGFDPAKNPNFDEYLANMGLKRTASLARDLGVQQAEAPARQRITQQTRQEVIDTDADIEVGDDITLSNILNKEDNTKQKRHALSGNLIKQQVLTEKQKNLVRQAVIDAIKNGKFPDLKGTVKGKNFLVRKYLLDTFAKQLMKVIKNGLGTGNKYNNLLESDFLYEFVMRDIPLHVLTNSGMKAFYKPVLDENGNQKLYTKEEAEMILGLSPKDRKSETGRGIFRKATAQEFTKKDFKNWALTQGDKLDIGVNPKTNKPYSRNAKGERKTWIAERIAEALAFDAVMAVTQNPQQNTFDAKGDPILDTDGNNVTVNLLEGITEKQATNLQKSSLIAELGAAIDRDPTIKFSAKTGAERSIKQVIDNMSETDRLSFIGQNQDNITAFANSYINEEENINIAFDKVYGNTVIEKYKEDVVKAFSKLDKAFNRYLSNKDKKTPEVYIKRFGKQSQQEVAINTAFNAANPVQYVATMLGVNSSDININKLSPEQLTTLQNDIVDFLSRYVEITGKDANYIINSFARGLAHGRRQPGSYFEVNKDLKQKLIDKLFPNNNIVTGVSKETYVDREGNERSGTSLFENNKPVKDPIQSQTVKDLVGSDVMPNKISKSIANKYKKQTDKSRERVYEILEDFKKVINSTENLKYSDSKAMAAILYSFITDMNTVFKMGGKLTAYAVDPKSKKTKDYVFAHFPSSSFLINKAIQFVMDKDSNIDEFKRHYDNSIVAIIPRKMDVNINQFNRNTVTIDYDVDGNIDPLAIIRNTPLLKENTFDILDIDTDAVIGVSKNKQSVTVKESSNINKAIANARKKDKKTKGISIFDFDDTLAETGSMIKYTLPDGKKGRLTGKQWLDFDKPGAIFDFSEFSQVIEGKKGPIFDLAQNRKEKFGPDNIFVLTARPKDAAVPIFEFLREIGLELPLQNIVALENSTAKAKADWVVSKAAEGYNDFAFYDDAYKNVKAVQDVLNVVDVKSDVQQVIVKESLNKDFNKIIENKTGVEWSKRYSAAKARTVGANKGNYNFFISNSAEDFMGLMYQIVGKGKKGDEHMAWIKEKVVRPFTIAMNAVDGDRVQMMSDYNKLKKKLKNVPKDLKKEIPGEGFTNEQAIRVYIWNKQGATIPDMLKGDINTLVSHVKKNKDLLSFAEHLILITKQDGYVKPNSGWTTGTITTDLLETINTVKRARHLKESGWTDNVSEIFSEKNLNKLEALYGRSYREALSDALRRAQTGRNQQNVSKNPTIKAITDWINGSVGVIMFLNTRSAVLQLISSINFVNWSDNNVLNAGKALANVKQYYKDLIFLMNSDYLVARRQGLKLNIAEADIADMAETYGNSIKGIINYMLKKGFTLTQIADSIAIASGGATFYRNRINTYKKQGLSQKEAESKAFIDFREIAEETQQSSNPLLISQQQASDIGRIILAFANTPSQYARLIKKSIQDLYNGRGDARTNVSKIVYYMFIQNLIFNAMQQALFALAFDDESPEEEKKKYADTANGMLDSLLRGMGYAGAGVSTIKNTIIRLYRESKDPRPEYADATLELLSFSPPIDAKISRLRRAALNMQYSKEGFGLNMESVEASALVVAGLTNFPADIILRKYNNSAAAMNQENEWWQRIALSLGWPEYSLGITESKKEDEKDKNIKNWSNKSRTIRDNKGSRVDKPRPYRK